MTTEEALEELENIRTPWEYLDEAKKAVAVVKAALADATARAERAERERDRLIESRTLHFLDGQTQGWWCGPFDTRNDAVRAAAAANLDAPATGEGE